jgi:hypothetical protein
VAASENAPEFLEVPLKLILGAPVESAIERELLAVITGLTDSTEFSGQMIYLRSFPLRNELYSVVTHSVNSQRVIQFEEIDQLVSPELMNAIITNFVGKLNH